MASDDFRVSYIIEYSRLETLVNYGFMNLVSRGCVGVDILSRKINLRPENEFKRSLYF